MKKNLAKKKFYSKRASKEDGPSKIRWRWILLIVFLALLFCTSAIFAIYYKKSFANLSTISYFKPMMKWVVAKENTNSEPAPKQIVLNKEIPDQQIHYEFYSSLPNMKVSVPEHDEMSKKNQIVALVSPENIEDDLSKHFQTKMFFLQFGVFKNFKAAERFQKQLTLAGLTVSIVKVSDKDREFYRVQEGPFFSLSQAKISQKNSMKKGVSGIIRNA